MKNERKNISQPADWWAAFQVEADRTHGGNLSAWLGDAGKAALPKIVLVMLDDRNPPNRPKQTPESRPKRKK